MQIFIDRIQIDARLAEVTVIAPNDIDAPNVQELAENAWQSVNEEITVGKITVKVRGLP